MATNKEPEILHEDESILAINKPAGMLVHADSNNKKGTLVDWLLKNYPEIKNVGEPGRNSKGETVNRSGIVHRLDRETSGVMLIAKNQKAFENLKSQFQKHEIKKIYHAFVHGKLKEDHGVINRPIGRSSKDFRMWSAQRGARGEMREAETNYKVLKIGKDCTFVEITPKTGRTHQIRVHFKAISHPLVADSLYAPKRDKILGFNRLALHSEQITFRDIKGNQKTVTAPYPEDFVQALVTLQGS